MLTASPATTVRGGPGEVIVVSLKPQPSVAPYSGEDAGLAWMGAIGSRTRAEPEMSSSVSKVLLVLLVNPFRDVLHVGIHKPGRRLSELIIRNSIRVLGKRGHLGQAS